LYLDLNVYASVFSLSYLIVILKWSHIKAYQMFWRR